MERRWRWRRWILLCAGS